ncbi:unnamed protein product, partial [marine sediment metagenome]
IIIPEIILKFFGFNEAILFNPLLKSKLYAN